MNKHYEEIVTAKYLGYRQYEVTVSEIEVTKKGKGEEIRKTLRNAKAVFVEPTILSSFFAGETLVESYKRGIFKLDEEFKLYDFNNYSLHSIEEALRQAAEKADRVLPQPYVF